MSDPVFPPPAGPSGSVDAIPLDAIPADTLPAVDSHVDARTDDSPIPMLTDVVHLPRYAAGELPASLTGLDWSELAGRVRENVMERLLRRSEMLLDTQLRDHLRIVLERSAEVLAVELHDALSQMIRDLVARAVNEELTRIHAEILHRDQTRAAAPDAAAAAPSESAPAAGAPDPGPRASGAPDPARPEST